MATLGFEMDGSVLRWVELHGKATAFEVGASGRIKLTDTRNRDAILQFGKALQALFDEVGPAVIGIKEKPEGKGRMTAGPGSSKIEALILYLSPVAPVFISGSKINKCLATHEKIKEGGPDEPAFKAAICALSA